MIVNIHRLFKLNYHMRFSPDRYVNRAKLRAWTRFTSEYKTDVKRDETILNKSLLTS